MAGTVSAEIMYKQRRDLNEREEPVVERWLRAITVKVLTEVR